MDQAQTELIDRFRTGAALRGRLFGHLVDEAGAGPKLSSGAEVGPWTVLELLGSGGMANVYLAKRTDEAFEQLVALKVVRRNTGLVDRLRHERDLIATLRHPHIVSLIDGGETADGDLWLAMALVEGVPIDAYAEQQKLEWRARIELFDAVCGAVEYAHGRALIHRDIKPANILVDGDGHPRLLDFGIAFEQSTGDGGDRAMTPGYAAPEQIAGEPLTTSPDIYHLGLVLKRLMQVESAPPMPRSARSDLAALIDRAIAAEPARRHATVAALREDLAALLARRPLAQHANSWRIGAARFVERHRLPLAVTAAATLALTIGLIASAMQLRNERDRALANEQRAEAIARFLVDTLAQANPWSAAGSGGTVLEAMDRAAERLDDGLDESIDVRRELREAIANVYTMIDEPKRCLTLLSTPSAEQDGRTAPGLQQAKLAIMRSECHLALDEREPSWTWLDHAERALADNATPEADRLRAWILADKGQLLSLNGKLEEANLELERALTLAKRSGSHEQEYRSYRMLGVNLQASNQFERSADLLRRAAEISAKTLGPTHRSTLTTIGHLAASLDRIGRTEEAERLLQDALASLASVKLRDGEAQIVAAQLQFNLATLYFQRLRLDECIVQARAAFDITVRVTPASSSQGFNPSWRVASCAYTAGDFALAKEYAQHALRYAQNGVPTGVINAERMLAAIAARAGDVAKANEHLQRAETAFASTEVTSPTILTALQLTRALCALASNDRSAAARHLNDADERLAAATNTPAWLTQEREQVAALVGADAPAVVTHPTD